MWYKVSDVEPALMFRLYHLYNISHNVIDIIFDWYICTISEAVLEEPGAL